MSSPAGPSGLRGAVVAVAGAGGPSGRAVVRRLVGAGAVVIAADHDEERLAPVTSIDANVSGEVVDLLDPQATQDWVGGIERDHGQLDGMVHLVGGWRGAKALDERALEHWAQLEPLLVRSLQHTSLAARDALAASPRGRFVIVSAAGAASPTAGNAAYAAAKAAAEAWTQALADSFARAGVGTGEQTGDTAPAAAAAIVVVKALLDDEMRVAKPDAAFAGFTHVDDLAEAIAALWDRPATELNGTHQWLTSPS